MTLRAPSLKPGDGIGVIAPAGPVSSSELQTGIELLETRGYRVFPSTHLYDRERYLAGDDLSRLWDLQAMFEDPDIKAIFCARGGYGSLRLLERIDFDLIARNPKIFVGYSDITALLLALYKMTGLITFHGPVVKDLGKKANQNLIALLRLLSSDNPFSLQFVKGMAIKNGTARGILVGGNLTLLCHLVGTPFMPSLEGTILFLEETGEPLYRIDRMITHLRLSGCLDGLAGLLLGEFSRCGSPRSIHRIFLDALSTLEIPVVAGLPVGHGQENRTLPVGVRAQLDTEEMTLFIPDPLITL